MAGRIVVIGSLNADLVVRVPRFPAPGETLTGSAFSRFPGGKGANQAYAAARLGAPVAMVGQVGDDDLGRWLVKHLSDGGVDTSGIGTSAGDTTGLALISIDASGQNEIVLVPGANGTFRPDRLLASMPSLADATVLLQLEVPLETVVAAARRARADGARVVLDPAPARELPSDLLEHLDLVTPNESELTAITGGGTLGGEQDVIVRAERLRARGAREVIVKLGAEGVRLVGAAGTRTWPARRVVTLDSTAAGDTFNGALAAGLATGLAFDAACARAVAAATLSVTRAGAQPSMPTSAELDAWLSAENVPRWRDA